MFSAFYLLGQGLCKQTASNLARGATGGVYINWPIHVVDELKINMSDTGRKNFADKVEETVKPDSQKSTLDQAKEKATDLYDTAAAKLTPTENKSVGQTAADTASDAKSDVKNAAGSVGGESKEGGLYDQAQEYLHSGQEAAKHYADQAKEYVNSDAAKGYIKNAGDYVHKASEYL